MTLEPDTGESDSTIRWSTEVESTKVSYTDINHDGILELPSAYALPDQQCGDGPNFWAIRWWQYDINGFLIWYIPPTTTAGRLVLCSARGVVGEGDALPQRLGGRRRAGRNLFLLGGSADTAPVPFLVIYKLTGDNRVMRANMADRFLLPNTGERRPFMPRA